MPYGNVPSRESTTKERISDKVFQRLSEFIHTECGIKMPSTKRTMLEARLMKRLRALNMGSYQEYCDYVMSPKGIEEELIHMIDVVTTNKTDFFREPAHFDYLTHHAVPMLIQADNAGISRKLSVWSAGCSTGEEPYTIAMTLKEFSETCAGFYFMILATDISTRVLEQAQRAIYCEDRVIPVPALLKKKYLLKGKDNHKGLVRVVPALRSSIKFRRLNFLEEDYGFRETMDIIFCRNVIIYFDRSTQQRVLSKFCSHLAAGGFLFMGHSETLNGLDLPLVQVAPTIYRKLS